jgi:hypothetical protein
MHKDGEIINIQAHILVTISRVSHPYVRVS